MICRGPGFLAVAWFGSSPTPSPPISNLSLFLSLSVCRWPSLLIWGRRRGWGRSQIMRRRVSGVLYKSFSTLRGWGEELRYGLIIKNMYVWYAVEVSSVKKDIIVWLIRSNVILFIFKSILFISLKIKSSFLNTRILNINDRSTCFKGPFGQIRVGWTFVSLIICW